MPTDRWRRWSRHPDDREIHWIAQPLGEDPLDHGPALRVAVPALGALVAEPVYY